MNGCGTAIQVSSVYPGALVSVHRDGRVAQQHYFDESKLWIPLSEPLHVGEKIQMIQEVEAKCERPGTLSNPISVSDAAPVHPPIIAGPLCENTVEINYPTSVRAQRCTSSTTTGR
ncbi:hypothetical protein AX16_001199 [Volvariella volvacea WC 439]|nr:hypothetical protein AX16_001199 [Volvariella volvacea WC 439]